MPLQQGGSSRKLRAGVNSDVCLAERKDVSAEQGWQCPEPSPELRDGAHSRAWLWELLSASVHLFV